MFRIVDLQSMYRWKELGWTRKKKARTDKKWAQRFLKSYVPEWWKPFLEGECEPRKTIDRYLSGRAGLDWYLLAFLDGNDLLGGFHFQVLNILGTRYAWGEHLWVKPGHTSVCQMLPSILRRELLQRNVRRVFLEFNDPEKMTPEEIAIDCAAGTDPFKRLGVWGVLGFYQVIDALRRVLAYAQPGMDGQPPVNYLSLAFADLVAGRSGLEGLEMPLEEYLEVCHVAHETIRGVKRFTDPTCVGYTRQVLAQPGPFRFEPLILRAQEARKMLRTHDSRI